MSRPDPAAAGSFRPGVITTRTSLRAGDIGAIARMHGVVYAAEHQFDVTFEAYVAGPLSQFALEGSERQRLWIAEREGEIVGCVAIVAGGEDVAQLRWFLVHPTARGAGLGRTLLREAVGFSRARGYRSIVLWTVRALTAAAHLYRAEGFRLAEEKPGRRWGVEVMEERYEMML